MNPSEVVLIRRWQAVAGHAPVVRLARAYSVWGEHAAGWMLLGLAGAYADRPRRGVWLGVTGSAFTGHAAAVVLKRVVRRRRPPGEHVRVLVATPSELSFPSAHAASTAAACLALVPIIGRPAAGAAVLGMLAARVLLGVHYPSDVAAGAAVGTLSAVAGRRATSAVRAR